MVGWNAEVLLDSLRWPLLCSLFLSGSALAGSTADPVDAAAVDEPGTVLGPQGEIPGLGGPNEGAGSWNIINGASASEDVYPETGAVIVELTGYEPLFSCSSTLIAPDVVILAAHCIDPDVYGVDVESVGWTRQPDVTLWLDGDNPEWPDDVVMAKDWVMHDLWDIASLSYGLAENYDIALLFLNQPVTDVQPAVVVTLDEAEEISEGDAITIVGWGVQSDEADGISGYKMWGETDLSRLATYEFQVGQDEDAVRKCYGDSGGPTFRAYPDSDSTVKERIIGVTSHTYDVSGCSETGGVDTRVDYYWLWVDSEMTARCQDGSRAWCDEYGILDPPTKVTSVDDLYSDIKLIGCSTSSGLPGAWSALGGLALALARLRGRRRG